MSFPFPSFDDLMGDDENGTELVACPICIGTWGACTRCGGTGEVPIGELSPEERYVWDGERVDEDGNPIDEETD